MKKTIFKSLILFVLLIIYSYVLLIQSIPNNITIFEGEQINLKTILGLHAYLTEENEIVETLSNNQTKTMNNVGKNTIKISLFEDIFLKNVNVEVLPKTKVIPVGSIAGIKLYTSGILVVRNV